MIPMRIILKPSGLVIMVAVLAALTLVAVNTQNKKAPVSEGLRLPSPDSGGIVYDGALRNDWSDFSWAKTDLKNAVISAPGLCIRVAPNKFEAAYFHHVPMSIASYDRLAFRINGGDTGGQKLRLVARYIKNKEEKNGTEYILPTPLSKRWMSLTVTLAELGVAEQPNFTGFWIQEGGGETASPFYIDDLRFLRPGDPAPSDAGK